jgi:polyhydroxyalkanoate synthase
VERQDQDMVSTHAHDWRSSFQSIVKEALELPFTFEKAFSDKNIRLYSAFHPKHVVKTFADLSAQLFQHPEIWESTYNHFFKETTKLGEYFIRRLWGETPSPHYTPDRKDRRFRDKVWEENPFFDTAKQMYLMLCEAVLHSCTTLHTTDPLLKRKRHFFVRQLLDSCAPTNFIFSNPVVLRALFESGGLNFIHGTERFLSDLNRGKGKLNIASTDTSFFEVGKDLAATPGKVIFQNDILQLIQYAPTTETVQKRPVLIIPPWINKYYILDLKPENSFVKWLVSTGVTVFMISWVKATPHHAHKSFEDYMREGIFDSLTAIHQATKATSANIIGYCLGGTLLLNALAYCLHPKCAEKPKMRVASATLLTTLTDFRDAGDLTILADDEELSHIEKCMAQEGFLNGKILFDTFNVLRANDLIWSYFVDSYLLGKTPPPHDILFWNADVTNMPRALHSFILRNFYRKNLLVQPNALKIRGVPIDLQRIHLPIFMLSTRDDHIAPWKATYTATQFLKSPDLTFVLAGSGHVAGIINPPAAQKYGYWTYNAYPSSAEDWLAYAKETSGSWWPTWRQWLEKYAGGYVSARFPKENLVLENAPGTYVLD